MRIYLDNCCYNRPFDDQSFDRIYLESEAILSILNRGYQGIDTIIGSTILTIEMQHLKDETKQQKVLSLYGIADIIVPYSLEVKQRSQEIMSQSNIRTFDWLHIAAAEAGNADYMLTTDDKLEKMSARLNLSVKVLNPLKYVCEVI